MVWYSHLFKNFSQCVVIHTVKGFSIANEADVFLEFSCILYDPVNVGNLIFGSSAFSKFSLYIRKFSIQVLLKLSLMDFEHNLTKMGSEGNCQAVSAFFSTTLLGTEMKIDLFQSCGYYWTLQIC